MRVVVYCARQTEPHAPLRRWDSITDALDAAQVVPCDGLCAGVHIVCWSQQGRMHAEVIDHHRRTYSRQREFELAYPRAAASRSPEFWPTPASFNQPLKEYPMTSPQGLTPEALQKLQDQAVRDAPGHYEEVGGAGQAAFEDHDLARQLRRTGDPLDAISADGHDQSAQAMVDSELAGWRDENENPAVGVVGDPAALGFLRWSEVSESPGDSTQG
jgi:hypothetical protein